ncbi:MAG TPA: FAD-dependent oxidoreductase [Chitinophagaceae bacterium]|nr:FAD-dependent oxidoreductase [Chitinophagaceae bacterium]
MNKYFLLPLILISSNFSYAQKYQYDVCVYGGTAAGVIAAYTASKMGKSVVLVEPGKHLGGLTTGGLGYTDIGNKYAISGLSLDFYRRIGKHYGKFEQWIFEPHVAEEILLGYIKRCKATVMFQQRIISTKKYKGFLQNIVIENSEHPDGSANKTVHAKMFIDCSYEGDLMAKAGVSYFVGREDNSLYGETYNGVQLRDQHQFPDGIDPYKIQGDPSGGLLWGISPETLKPKGSGDKKVQAYNFRVCLTNRDDNRIPITRPADYDSLKYELLLRYLQKKKPVNLNDRVLKIDMMPNGKTDINNNGPFSTDMIGMNYNYPEAYYATRYKIVKAHENYVKGLLYFLGHDQRVPQHLRKEMLQWGYPKDEYKDNGNWSPQMYVREARRMIGKYVMTQHNCEGRTVADDTAGMAAYTMDSHNCQRIVVNGMVKNAGDVQVGGFGPYPVSYRSLIPKDDECRNLLVPVCMSATHIAYGSIRMEPVFMVLAQSAAVAAALAIDTKKPVQEVDVKKIQAILKYNPLIDGSEPEILVDNDDPDQVRIEGSWNKEKSGSFGPSRLVSNVSDTGKGFVQFSSDIKKDNKYVIYTYFSKIPKTAEETILEIFDGRKTTEIKLRASSIMIAGQTSGAWISLGEYELKKGTQSHVKFFNKGKEGLVTADAVLLVPYRNSN